jgi:hypothetical protein
MDLFEAEGEGPYVRFFEQAFEWEHMTWVTYPYFWVARASGTSGRDATILTRPSRTSCVDRERLQQVLAQRGFDADAYSL